MTPIDYIIMGLAIVGMLVCIAGYASTFIPPRKRHPNWCPACTKPYRECRCNGVAR